MCIYIYIYTYVVFNFLSGVLRSWRDLFAWMKMKRFSKQTWPLWPKLLLHQLCLDSRSVLLWHLQALNLLCMYRSSTQQDRLTIILSGAWLKHLCWKTRSLKPLYLACLFRVCWASCLTSLRDAACHARRHGKTVSAEAPPWHGKACKNGFHQLLSAALYLTETTNLN